MRIATTGYVSTQEGSVAGANAVFVRNLLALGHRVTFHSKSSFVDPRPAVEDCDAADQFRFVDCTNPFPDRLAQFMTRHRYSLPGRLISAIEHNSYNRYLAVSMRMSAAESPSDLSLWMGTWAQSRMDGVPTVSYAQGPPGTDARSVPRYRALIEKLTDRRFYLKLAAFARWRMITGLGVARHSDHVIVGSRWAKQDAQSLLDLPDDRIHTLPYPIDLELFRPYAHSRPTSGPLRVLWLGRFVPRKRLDLFLDAIAECVRNGIDVQATIVGRSGFVPNFEKLIEEFPFPDRITHRDHIPRSSVPELMWNSDVLIQPSEDENFGSSVAEALACGIPAIVGSSNGTADYLCPRSIHLRDDRTETLAGAIDVLARAKRDGDLSDPLPTRDAAVEFFCPHRVTRQLELLLELSVAGHRQYAI